VESQSFLDIPISPVYLCTRSGVSSILVGTLLAAVRGQDFAKKLVRRDLVDIVNGHPLAQSVKLATSRVPVFGTDGLNTAHAYRVLGSLSDTPVRFEIPPSSPSAADRDRELLAMRMDHEACQDFIKSWGALGIDPKNHFIIIFIFVEPTPSHLFNNNSWQSHPPSIGYDTPSPIFSSGSGGVDLFGFREASGANSPALSGPHNSDNGVESLGYSAAASPTPGNWDESSTTGVNSMVLIQPNTVDTTTSDATRNVHGFSILAQTHSMAQYQARCGSLIAMVLNHRAMSQILVVLGYQQPNVVADTFYPGTAIHLPDGQNCTAGDIVREFGWSPKSFRQKTGWYGWAEIVAKSKVWSGAIPSEFLLSLPVDP